MYICLVTWILLSATVDGSDVTVSGQVGRSVRIKCSHKFAVNNGKYFCRDPCTDQHVLIKSGQPPTGKYKLKDLGKGVFTVTITDLQTSDTGTYWCAVERYMKDTYHKVFLTVTDEVTSTAAPVKTVGSSERSTFPPPTISFSASSPAEESLSLESTGGHTGVILYTVAGLVAMVIVIGLCLITLYKVKRTNRSFKSSGS
ncbi:hypothetical protein MHYP_G00101360 [Metynnis hypsauchen]